MANTTNVIIGTTGKLEVLGLVDDHHEDWARCALIWVRNNITKLKQKMGANKNLKVSSFVWHCIILLLIIILIINIQNNRLW